MNSEQCRAARALLKITPQELVALSTVSIDLLRAFEAGKRTPQKATILKIRATLVVAGIEFLSDAEGYGVKLRVQPVNKTALGALVARDKFEFDPGSLPVITASQCRAARGFLKWSQIQGAKQLGVGLSLLVHFENGSQPQVKSLQKIKAGFEQRGISFDREYSVLSVSLREE